MKKYIVHYYINGNILCIEVEADNLLSAAATCFSRHGVHLDQLVAINEKPFIQRVIGYIKSMGGRDASIPPATVS